MSAAYAEPLRSSRPFFAFGPQLRGKLSYALGNRRHRHLDAGAQAMAAHNQALWRAVNRFFAVIPAAIVLIVAVSMGIGAAVLSYPVWAIPLIALFGAGGAIVAIRVLG
jgi:hypothetical protein